MRLSPAKNLRLAHQIFVLRIEFFRVIRIIECETDIYRLNPSIFGLYVSKRGRRLEWTVRRMHSSIFGITGGDDYPQMHSVGHNLHTLRIDYLLVRLSRLHDVKILANFSNGSSEREKVSRKKVVKILGNEQKFAKIYRRISSDAPIWKGCVSVFWRLFMAHISRVGNLICMLLPQFAPSSVFALSQSNSWVKKASRVNNLLGKCKTCLTCHRKLHDLPYFLLYSQCKPASTLQ